MQVSILSNGIVLGMMEFITLFLVSQEIMGWSREIAHTSNDDYWDGPQGDDDWNSRGSEEQEVTLEETQKVGS